MTRAASLLRDIGALTLPLFVATGCRVRDVLFARPDAPPVPRVLWFVENVTNQGKPWFDDSPVWFEGIHHDITAIDKFTGEIRWVTTLPVEHPGTVGFGGFVHEGGVVVGDQDLFALDALDGRMLWRFAPTDGVDIGRDPPQLWEDLVLAGSSNGYVFGVGFATGRERWRVRVGISAKFVAWLAPVTGGVLFAGTTDFVGGARGGVAALDAATGRSLWSAALPYNVDTLAPTATINPIAAGSVVIAGARDGPLYGFDRVTGQLRWKAPALQEQPPFAPLDSALLRDVRPLAVSGSLVLAGSTTGILVALDPETGGEAWRASTVSHGSIAGLSTDDSVAYAVLPVAGMDAFSTSDGKHRWDLKGQYFFEGRVAIDSDRIYGGSLPGVYALSR